MILTVGNNNVDHVFDKWHTRVSNHPIDYIFEILSFVVGIPIIVFLVCCRMVKKSTRTSCPGLFPVRYNKL